MDQLPWSTPAYLVRVGIQLLLQQSLIFHRQPLVSQGRNCCFRGGVYAMRASSAGGRSSLFFLMQLQACRCACALLVYGSALAFHASSGERIPFRSEVVHDVPGSSQGQLQRHRCKTLDERSSGCVHTQGKPLAVTGCSVTGCSVKHQCRSSAKTAGTQLGQNCRRSCAIRGATRSRGACSWRQVLERRFLKIRLPAPR